MSRRCAALTTELNRTAKKTELQLFLSARKSEKRKIFTFKRKIFFLFRIVLKVCVLCANYFSNVGYYTGLLLSVLSEINQHESLCFQYVDENFEDHYDYAKKL